MAVLKRVCEDTPRPIREVNPGVPDALIEVIAKLHAKEPAERFQSAEEVAELLSQHLAHLQQPEILSAPAPLPQGPRRLHPPFGEHRRRWLVAAAVLLVLGGLGLTEATGVPSLAATVIRVFLPDGTLVVEVDDPQVKVTIEGDGGVVITGAGPQEVRLKPGNYRVLAAKHGKAIQEELVSIIRGGKQVVKVSVELTGAPTAALARLAPEEEKKVIMGLYNRYCIRCHGVDGRGVWDIPKVRNFTNARWQASRSDAEIVRAILEGRGGTPERRRDGLTLPPPSRTTGILQWAVMPSFRGTLTPEQAGGMARFLRTFAPATETPRPDLNQNAKPTAPPK
jgi:mono/diheme cytochrome c family protein